MNLALNLINKNIFFNFFYYYYNNVQFKIAKDGVFSRIIKYVSDD